MKTKRLAWVSVALYVVVCGMLLVLGGCVKGEPFAPEMCVVYMDNLSVTISARTLRICARPTIQREVRRP